jgi:hypothetical protein
MGKLAAIAAGRCMRHQGACGSWLSQLHSYKNGEKIADDPTRATRAAKQS